VASTRSFTISSRRKMKSTCKAAAGNTSMCASWLNSWPPAPLPAALPNGECALLCLPAVPAVLCRVMLCVCMPADLDEIGLQQVLGILNVVRVHT
jgi:hypothetical protein